MDNNERYQIEDSLIEWELDLQECEGALKNLSDGNINLNRDTCEQDIEFYEAEIAKAKKAISVLWARLEKAGVVDYGRKDAEGDR